MAVLVVLLAIVLELRRRILALLAALAQHLVALVGGWGDELAGQEQGARRGVKD